MKKARGQLRAFDCSHVFDSIGEECSSSIFIYERSHVGIHGDLLEGTEYLVSLCEYSEHVACVSDEIHID